MLRTSTITMLLVLFASAATASELETVLEWQGTIHTTDVENAHTYCTGFPNSKNDIKDFFNHASVVSEIKIPETKCSAEGVAKNEKGTIVDWWLFQGGVGYIVNKETTTSYACIKGTMCCELLPHICNAQP